MPDNSKTILQEGIIIGLITAFVYFGAYVYEVVYANYFLIPSELIYVSAELILSAFFGLIGFVFVMFFIINLFLPIVWPGVKDRNTPLKRVSFVYLFMCILVLVLIIGLGYDSIVTIIVVFMLSIYILADLIPAFISKFTSKDKKSFLSHLDEVMFDSDRQGYDAYKLMQIWLGRDYYNVVVWLGMFIGFCAIAGNFAAKREREFITSYDESVVLIRNYGDLYIFKELDIHNHELKNKIIVMVAEDLSATEFKKTKIDDLLVAEYK